MVWLAVLICAGLDRLLGRPEAVYESSEGSAKKRKPLAVWQRIALVPLGILVIPGIVVVMIPVLTLYGLFALSQWAWHRSRAALFGIPTSAASKMD
jgi:hypothetical protein